MSEELVNKIAQSGLITIKLEEWLPEVETAYFDIKEYLFQGLILKEKDFRAALKEHDWAQYQDKVVLIYCSADAIVPVWANMLIAAYAAPFAAEVLEGKEEDYYRQALDREIAALDAGKYAGERLVIKGCSDRPVPLSAYVALTSKLQPHAKSIMFGEPCSTVPIYKQKVQRSRSK